MILAHVRSIMYMPREVYIHRRVDSTWRRQLLSSTQQGMQLRIVDPYIGKCLAPERSVLMINAGEAEVDRIAYIRTDVGRHLKSTAMRRKVCERGQ